MDPFSNGRQRGGARIPATRLVAESRSGDRRTPRRSLVDVRGSPGCRGHLVRVSVRKPGEQRATAGHRAAHAVKGLIIGLAVVIIIGGCVSPRDRIGEALEVEWLE